MEDTPSDMDCICVSISRRLVGLSIWGTLSSGFFKLSCWVDQLLTAESSLVVIVLSSSFWDAIWVLLGFVGAEERAS